MRLVKLAIYTVLTRHVIKTRCDVTARSSIQPAASPTWLTCEQRCYRRLSAFSRSFLAVRVRLTETQEPLIWYRPSSRVSSCEYTIPTSDMTGKSVVCRLGSTARLRAIAIVRRSGKSGVRFIFTRAATALHVSPDLTSRGEMFHPIFA